MGFCSKVLVDQDKTRLTGAHMNILAPLHINLSGISKTTFRQMNQIIAAMLSMTGRVTMLGLSRWAGEGGSYRTIQRFYSTVIPWAQVLWEFFCQTLFRLGETYILAGDECVDSKAGKKTYGLDRFFSGLQQKVIPGLSFFVLSLVSVSQRHAYPVAMEQTVRSAEEKAACKVKKETKKVKTTGPKRKPGRPKGSKNKDKTTIALSPELQRIQKMLKSLLMRMISFLRPTYLALDGHFGNYPAFQMVRQCELHLISKLRWDAALSFPWDGVGRRRKYGKRVDYAHIPEKYLKFTTVKDGFQTCTYQAQLLHTDFSVPLNVVIIVKTNLATQASGHVILFSSDLDLSCELLVDYYSLRFQIEFNFRDAKQFWGLEDFMNVTPTAVTNAANLSLLMVNVSEVLMCDSRQTNPDFGVLDLKSYYRGCKYATELLKILPEKPDDIFVAQLFRKMAALGSIHAAKTPV
jgi:putative transposase